MSLSDNIPDRIFLYRIIHIDNLEYILNVGKLTCPNHRQKDANYIGIGDDSLIRKRTQKKILIDPGGTFFDYIAFYFGPRSPMLYSITKGNIFVQKRNQEDIIYLVATFEKIKSSKNKYVFSDGHASNHLSNFFNEESELRKIPWDMVREEFWKDDETDYDRKRKKQAEFFVYHELDINYLEGIAVFSQSALDKVNILLSKYQRSIKTRIWKKGYY